MKKFKHFAQRYVDWVIRLGGIKFSLLGISILAVLAICTQILFSLFIIHQISWIDIWRSVTFGLLTAPFVIYFFTLLVEKLERSRLDLARSVTRLENEVNERIIAQQNLSNALERLEKNSQEKSRLLATISHELRTPLNGIVGLSQILLDENLDERQQNYLKTINISAVSLGYIFSDIIDLEKIDAGRIELNCQPTDFQGLLNDIHNFADFMAKQKNLNFHLISSTALPHWIKLDRVRLSQILWNLISNAVKFTSKGDITLRIDKLNSSCYSFTITDSGMGIEKEEQKHIFDMYYQVKDTPQKSAGSGIGLAISKNLANLMKGDLIVESELGKGATFTLTIQAEESSPPDSSDCYAVSPLTILLVEDVELNIVVAKTLLEKLGHKVDVAKSGKEAISLFEKNLYDLLLLDIKLPDMTGFDIAQYLRKNYEDGIYDFLPPLIAFTANVMQSEEEYIKMGMDGVLRKPISMMELHQCLRHFFGDEQTHSFKVEDNKDSAHPKFDTELIHNIGKKHNLDNLMLLKEVMPLYLSKLTTDDRNQISDTAHKIKGASASVGLKIVSQFAGKLEESAKTSNITDIEQMVKDLYIQWEKDADELIQYLK